MSDWTPPSDILKHEDGVWQPLAVSPVSYPGDGNNTCYQIEDSSYWFAHRNNCILEVVRQHPPAGAVYDIGGGNGFVAAGIQQAGMDVVLVEPGHGALNAAKRGVKKIIRATLEDAAFKSKSLPAAAAFDVIEHVQDDVAFLDSVRQHLVPGGRFYCTVPALNFFWSDEDIRAGHHRRYSKASLCMALQNAGMQVEFVTHFFAWLSMPVFVLRALPFRMWGGRKATNQQMAADHNLPSTISGIVSKMHAWELARLRERRAIACGTSLLCVARSSDS